jgi:putative sugar O-methyltransferase
MIFFKKKSKELRYYRIGAIFENFYVQILNLGLCKESKIWSEKIFLKKRKSISLLYMNSFGRIIYYVANLFYFIFSRRFLDKDIAFDVSHQNSDNNYNDIVVRSPSVWPPQALHLNEKNVKLDSNDKGDYLDKVYNLSYSDYAKEIEDSQWWIDCKKEFRECFFQEKKVDLQRISSFRDGVKTKAFLLTDATWIFKKPGNTLRNAIGTLNLVTRYHLYSKVIDHDILRMISESYSGNSRCVVYRGQRLSYRILRHAYYFSQIRKYSDFDRHDSIRVMDIGGGYGNLLRIFAHYYKKGTYILIEQPEVIIFAIHFLSECFPDSKIGTILEIDEITDEVYDKYDFIILPTSKLGSFPSNSIDLIMSTTSIGEMSTNMQKIVYSEVERLTRKYFYSNNREFGGRGIFSDDFGFVNYKFKKSWHSKLYQKSHTYHIETFMEKLHS